MTPKATGQRAKGRITLVVLALLSVMVMTVSVILAFLLADRHEPGLTAETTPPAVSGGFACDPAEAAKLYPFRSGVIKVGESRISFLDMSGSEKWGADCKLISPSCYSDGSTMLIVDMNGGVFCVAGEQGILRQGTAAGTITGAAIGANGLFALVLEQADNKGLVRIMSAGNGKEYEWDFVSKKSGFVLSVSFSPSGKWVDIATLDTDRHSARSLLKRLETSTGVQLAQFMPENTGVFAVVAHDEAGGTVLVSADAAVGFHTDATVAYSQTFSRILRAISTPRGVLIVAVREPGGVAAAYLLPSSGILSEGVPLTGEPSAITVSGDRAGIAVGSTVSVLDLSPFSSIQTLNAGAEILRLAIVSPSTTTVVTREGVGRLSIN